MNITPAGFRCAVSSLGMAFLWALGTPVLWAADPTTQTPAKLTLVPVLPELIFNQPLWVEPIPDRAGELLVLEHAGVARRVGKDLDETFLDISDLVDLPKTPGSEEGLLSLAFHPQWAKNRVFFTWFSTKRSGHLQTVLARWTASADGTKANRDSEQPLITVDRPYTNHNGGDLHFGADGYLYLGLGDGGSGGDPKKNGQNLGVLLGKILRIDVDHQDGDLPYAIPKDNPFVKTAGARGEIWAYGIRNPWRMSFDAATGILWCGDVGQNLHEEINQIVKGGNYGWHFREGFSAFKNGAKALGMIDPVHDYGRDQGISVTGGCVYRGTAIPELVGAYVFGDFGSKRIWTLVQRDGKTLVTEVAKAKGGVASFGHDQNGELLVASFDGKIYRLEK